MGFITLKIKAAIFPPEILLPFYQITDNLHLVHPALFSSLLEQNIVFRNLFSTASSTMDLCHLCTVEVLYLALVNHC
jgi:hypothetical protein